MNGQVIDVEQRSAEWRELRRSRVTGSEIATILRNPDKGLRDHVHKALGLPGFEGNEATRYGTEAEPFAREWFELRNGLPVHEVGFIIDARESGFGCSPDGLIDDGQELQVVEFKCPFSGSLPSAPKADHVAQVRWNMGVCDAAHGVLVYWTPDGAVVFPIAQDVDWLAKARHEAAGMLAKAWIILQDPEEAQRWLAAQDAQSGFRSDAAWQAAAQAYLEASDALAAAEAAVEAARTELLAMSDGEAASGGGVRVGWYMRQGAVDWPKLAKAHAIPAAEIEAARKAPTRYARVTED